MEREILFKGQMVTGRWVYGLPSLDIKGSTAYWDECSYRISWSEESARKNAPIKNGTLCQFTGRFIKGERLFDGDKFRVRSSVKIIKYIDSKMAFCLINEDDIQYLETLGDGLYQTASDKLWNDFSDDMELIGNIHD